jgi:hypothetical protein
MRWCLRDLLLAGVRNLREILLIKLAVTEAASSEVPRAECIYLLVFPQSSPPSDLSFYTYLMNLNHRPSSKNKPEYQIAEQGRSKSSTSSSKNLTYMCVCPSLNTQTGNIKKAPPGVLSASPCSDSNSRRMFTGSRPNATPTTYLQSIFEKQCRHPETGTGSSSPRESSDIPFTPPIPPACLSGMMYSTVVVGFGPVLCSNCRGNR